MSRSRPFAETPTYRQRWFAAVLVLTVGVALAACGDDNSSSENTSGPAQARSATGLADTSWDLSVYTSSSGDSVDAASSSPANLAFTSDAVSGSTGCNQFTGTYTSDGSALTVTLGPMTQKACTDDEVQAQETAVLAQLAAVTSYTIDGTQLTLKDENDATVLVYSAGATTLEGTSWTATGVNNGKDAVVSTAETEQLTATFGADGALSGSGGCNEFTAEYTVSGSDGLTIGPIAATRKICSDEIMQAEDSYFAVLGATTTYSISGSTLTLRNADGATQVTYTAA